MAALESASWLIVSSELHRIVEERGWRNLSVEERKAITDGLARDIIMAERLCETVSSYLEAALRVEILQAKSAFAELLTGGLMVT